MQLTGHAGEVFSAKFSPDGKSIASVSFDRQIYLWNTFGDCENYMAMIGHAGAILDVRWSSDGEKIFTASSDKTCAVWDATTGERIRRLRGHASIVNCCCPARKSPLLASGSDDGTIKVRVFCLAYALLFYCILQLLLAQRYTESDRFTSVPCLCRSGTLDVEATCIHSEINIKLRQ